MYYLPGAEIFLLVLTSEENEGEGTGRNVCEVFGVCAESCGLTVIEHQKRQTFQKKTFQIGPKFCTEPHKASILVMTQFCVITL